VVHTVGAATRTSTPLLKRNAQKSENKAGIKASAHTIDTKIIVASKAPNLPWITIVWIIHLRSTRKKARPKKKPQAEALGNFFSLSRASNKGTNANHATNPRFQGAKAKDNSAPPVRDKIRESVMIRIGPTPNR
jgi:hypothetical protein